MVQKRSGALFSLGDCGNDDLTALLARFPKKPLQRELIEAIFDLCTTSPDSLTDMPTLRARLGGLDRATIIQRLKPILDAGAVEKGMERVHAGSRSAGVYRLCRPMESHPSGNGSLLLQSGDSPGLVLAPFADDSLDDVAQLTYHSELSQNLTLKAWRSAVFWMIGGLRVGRSGSELTYKKTRVYIGKGWFDLEARAVTNSQIPSILDLRILVVLCSLVKDYLENTSSPANPENGFLLTMTAMCEAMSLPANSGNKRYLYEVLSRWKTTAFEVKQAMYGAVDGLPLFNLKRQFNMLGDLLVLEHVSKDGNVPELIRLWLNPALLLELDDYYQTLSVHREILTERKPSPNMHLLYYWSRRVVKNKVQPKVYRVEHLWRELRSSITLPEYREDFSTVMSDYRMQGSLSRSIIPGYIYDHYKDIDSFAVNANPDDPIVVYQYQKLKQEQANKK